MNRWFRVGPRVFAMCQAINQNELKKKRQHLVSQFPHAALTIWLKFWLWNLRFLPNRLFLDLCQDNYPKDQCVCNWCSELTHEVKTSWQPHGGNDIMIAFANFIWGHEMVCGDSTLIHVHHFPSASNERPYRKGIYDEKNSTSEPGAPEHRRNPIRSSWFGNTDNLVKSLGPNSWTFCSAGDLAGLMHSYSVTDDLTMNKYDCAPRELKKAAS